MYSNVLVFGFHGCDRDVGERILGKGESDVRKSDNDYDWLGSGAYFWENSPRRALSWAEHAKANPKFFKHDVRDPFVVGAVINLGLCLDLTDSGSLRIIQRGFQALEDTFRKSESPLPKNEPSHGSDEDLVKRKLDCAVLNFVHLLREEEGLPMFDTVRGPFFEGEALYPGSRMTSRTHIQICVRNFDCILGYFRPRPKAFDEGFLAPPRRAEV